MTVPLARDRMFSLDFKLLSSMDYWSEYWGRSQHLEFQDGRWLECCCFKQLKFGLRHCSLRSEDLEFQDEQIKFVQRF